MRQAVAIVPRGYANRTVFELRGPLPEDNKKAERMTYLKVLVLVVHVAAASVVLGASLGWGRSLRQAAAAGAQAWDVVVADVSRRLILVRVTSMMTLFTGVGLIFLSGGFAVIPKTYHIALTLMLAAVGWVMFVLAPAVKALKQVQVGSSASPVNIGKIAMGTGVVHAVWLTLLVLMFVR
jgi:hypothetical protein